RRARRDHGGPNAMNWDVLVPAIAVLPLAGFGFPALVGRRLWKQAHSAPVAAVLVAWLIAMAVSFTALTGGEPFGEHGYGAVLFTWIPAGSFQVDVGFFVDNLPAFLPIVVPA